MGCGQSQPAVKEQQQPHKFYTIKDTYESIEEVQQALRKGGLESSNLIVGVDFTKSNEWSGQHSFYGRNLHSFDGQMLNPYEEVIEIIGETLSAFDDDKLIPTYGFGDVTSSDKNVFSFYPQDTPIYQLENVITRYRQIAPYVNLAGPTSFAPLIRHAINVVVRNQGAYHILLIVADGQISAQCRQATIQAILEASYFPLSIVMVGVGDGPFDEMKAFDDLLPQRKFDNFQFVNFTEQMMKAKQYNYAQERRKASFALNTLMEIPEQYQIIKKLKLMEPGATPRPQHITPPQDPPPEVQAMDKQTGAQGIQVVQTSAPPYPQQAPPAGPQIQMQYSQAQSSYPPYPQQGY
eukprot:TRINITY_DN460_c0_g3_i1.p1 TRINITY_DN460_c0_g3~~TRINITY_DN460_c0_g3_i1.p1  ORF type:complete len:350 (-),score=47.95 TRINITY_DN460_c0_g3_i1:408-1457(-)